MPAPLAGQVSVTGTAQQLSASALNVNAFTIKAPVGNSLPVYIGPAGVTTTTGHELDPGDSFSYERSEQNGGVTYQLRPSDIYVCGTATDKVTWFASP